MTTTAGANLSPSNVLGDPFVLYENTRFRMWFTGYDSQQRLGTAYAESPDGLVWTIGRKSPPADPVMDLFLVPGQGAWDSAGVETPWLIRAPSGEYRLYYTGDRSPGESHMQAIGLATSSNGITWRKRGPGPVFEPQNAWEQPTCTNPADPKTCATGGVLEPSVIYDARENLYKMWYAGLGVKDSVLAYRIGYATSPDGITWSRRADPVLDRGTDGTWEELWVSHTHVVPDSLSGYHLFYFGSRRADYCDGCVMQRGALGHAYSAAGVNWQRNPNNPILSPRVGSWDAWTVAGPSVLQRGNEFWLWYFGSADRQSLEFHIGLAKAPCAS